MDRLLREGNPPAGQLASPKPQYKKPGVDEYAPVEGQHGAPFATLKDASGNVVSPATEAKLEQVRALLSGVATENKLEQARVLLNTISTKDFATQTTLAAVLAKLGQLETEIQAVKANQLSGDQKVQLSGTITEVVLANGIDITAGSTVYILTSEIENVEFINLAKKARLYYNGTNIKDISITHYGRLGTGSATTAGTVLVTGLPGGYDTRILNDIVIEPLLLTKGSSQYTRFAFTNTGESDASSFRAVLALTI